MATGATRTPPDTRGKTQAAQVGRGASPRPPRRRRARRVALNVVGLLQRGVMIGLALAVLGLFAAGVVEQRWKEAQMRNQVAAQQAEVHSAAERNAALKADLAATSDEARRAWVESAARRQLNLAYPGETVYLVNWTEPAASPAPVAEAAPQAAPPAAPAESNWRRWWRVLSGG